MTPNKKPLTQRNFSHTSGAFVIRRKLFFGLSFVLAIIHDAQKEVNSLDHPKAAVTPPHPNTQKTQ